MTDTRDIVFENATPVLGSGDYGRSRRFYTDVLGFDIIEEGGEPARFGIFRRGRATLFVDSWKGPPTPTPGKWEAYIHVTDLTALLDEMESRKAPITRPMEETVYGMREFEVTDPDGNILCFGEDAD